MSWEQWPFYPQSLTDMIGPASGAESEQFVSLIISGCSERLGRPLTVLEPELDQEGNPLQAPDPDGLEPSRLKLRRIDHVNPREHFAPFCEALRELPGQEEACRRFDEDIARQIMQAAVESPAHISRFPAGYSCRLELIDQAAVIRHYRTPVAVVLSGQFLPDGPDAKKQILALVDELVIEKELGVGDWQKLYDQVEKLISREQFMQKYLERAREDNPEAAQIAEEEKMSVKDLFLKETRQIERIACAQWQMHKRERQSSFRSGLRHRFPSTWRESREAIAERIEPVLQDIRDFFGCEYLALFVSPQRFISFEGSSGQLCPFIFSGIGDDIKAEITHFNWNKAGMPIANQSGSQGPGNHHGVEGQQAPSVAILTQEEDVQRALQTGLKGTRTDLFDDATILSHMHLVDAYRAILVWGPFPHLTAAQLGQESRFLEEVSELVMMRILSLVQLSDSEYRTEAWGDVAGLLCHYSRRAMTPVSTGVRIVSEHLRRGAIYSEEDALKACESLEAASEFISQAVRAPLFSFAASTEAVYKFTPTALSTVVADCVALYHPMALQKDVEVYVEASVEDLPEAELDVMKIRDAIGYVLDNAIKYSHRNKEVVIYGEFKEMHVRLTIEDFGLGIREEERQLIFGRGYQGQRSRKATYEEGEGMGLYHARQIVEAHKGKIWCESRSGPRSSTSSRLEGYRVGFSIELPISQADS